MIFIFTTALVYHKEMCDSDKITVAKQYAPSDLGELTRHMVGELPLKMAGILYILYVLLNSDVFIHRVLERVPGAVRDVDVPTTKGTLLTGMVLCIFFIIFQLLVTKQVV